MTSATPIAPCSSSSSRTSAACTSAPGLSNGDAGTQLDAQIPNVIGSPAAAWASAATPRTPKTLASSCGSAATAVVPCGQDGAGELVDPELRRFQVHVRVDEAGRERGAGHVDDLAGLSRPPAGDDAVDDGQVLTQPLPGAGREDLPAA